MTVGRINGSNSVYNTNYVNRISPARFPSADTRLRDTPPAGEKHAAPAAGTLSTKNNSGIVLYNSDGDRAEISNNAMDLSRKLSEGNDSSPVQQSSQPQQNSGNIIFDYHMDLPSPFLDWETILNGTGGPDIPIGPALPENAPPPGSPPPGDTPTAGAPTGSIPPTDVPPNSAPTGNIPPTGATPGAIPSGGAKPKSDLPDITAGLQGFEPIEPKGACQTCQNRKYVDRSDDPSVSFQTPTKISPNMAASAVASHENEHVRNEQGKAERTGRQVVNQSVTFTYACCPECGRHYIAGGTTRTTTVNKPSHDNNKPDASASTGDKGSEN